MEKSARVYVAGHRGLVGSAIVRRLQAEGFQNILTAARDELDLRNQSAVSDWFRKRRPEFVFFAAGTVGGILPNSTRPAEFLYDNLIMHAAAVHAAHLFGARKLLYLGSSCIYPRDCPQPMKEEYLLTGPLESTNEAYAVAKISGIKLCQAYRRQYGSNFIAAMPTNLYGPFDNFDPQDSHVLPALLRRFHEAQRDGADRVTIWGTGKARREFLHVDDLAEACLFLMRRYEGELHINVGSGADLSIGELAEKIRDIVAPGVKIAFDPSKPDGMPRKLLDVSRIHALGWRSKISLDDGVRRTYEWFRKHYAEAVQGRYAGAELA
jgi:GDP-L-fucose synthase